MKRIGTLLTAFVLAMSMFGAAACGEGGGCGGPTEEELDSQAQSTTQQVTTTCGAGTRLVGNTCVRNATTPVQTQSATTLGN